ncbi:MAG: hypothetical protein CME06_02265 [Gemmatimonadetes bacterium]|nr:hypothetical protein [Gemmatimonadota bacterium]
MLNKLSLAVAIACCHLAVGIANAQFPVTVLQDCWTTKIEALPDPEYEDYLFFGFNEPITFVWKHKIMPADACSSYVASIFVLRCIDGKPKPTDIVMQFPDLRDEIVRWEGDPTNPEILFSYTAPPGSIPPGYYDWAMIVECNDSGNGIPLGPDGDIDDECGVNVGVPPIFAGPVIFGPEPAEFFDPDPGGFPPGRSPGEEGTTRPWCFQVL